MGKLALKKAGAAATQSMLRDLMPFMDERFTSLNQQIRSIHDDIRRIDGRLEELKSHIDARAEELLATINEVSHRVTRLDGKLEGFTQAMGLRLKMDDRIKQPKRRRVG